MGVQDLPYIKVTIYTIVAKKYCFVNVEQYVGKYLLLICRHG